MRASILISIAAFTLVLAACNETQSGRQAEGPPGNEAVAPPVGANDTNATIAGGPKRDWSSLDALIGKYPRKSGLLDNSAISDDLRKLLGPKFDVFKMNLETQALLQRDKSVLFLSGNKDNQGGSDAAYLLIDTKAKALEVGLWEAGRLSTYKTRGSNIAKPEDVMNLISNSSGS